MLPSEEVYSTESWKIGIESHRHILQGHRAPHKTSQGAVQRCEPQERNPCAPKFEDGTLQEWDLANNVYQLKARDKATFHSPTEAWVMLAPSWKKPEEQFPEHHSSCWAKRTQAQASWKPFENPGTPTTVIDANGDVQTSEEAQVYVHDLDLFVTVQTLFDTRADLSSGKLCEEHGNTCEWACGQKPHLTTNGKRILCKAEHVVPVVVPGLSSSSSARSSSTSFPQDWSSTISESSSHYEVTILTLGHRETEAILPESQTKMKKLRRTIKQREIDGRTSQSG